MARTPIALALCSACSPSGFGPVPMSGLPDVELEDDDGVESAPDGTLARRRRVGCPQGRYTSVQDAVDASDPGDVVILCAGTYRERVVISGNDVTLRSRPAGAAVIDAEQLGPAITVEGGADVRLRGLVIRNGLGDTGGNVTCRDSAIVVRNSTLEAGEADRGGGFGTTNCTGRVQGTTFVGNRAEDKGGGLYAGPDLDLLDNTFDANEAEQGGGAYLDTSTSTVSGNTFVANVATDDDGGGLLIQYGAPLIDGNTFDRNDADSEGGGLRVRSGAPTITGNLFVENRADWRGGGAKISHDEVEMAGNTFTNNTSSGWAGALLLFESASRLSDETFIGNESDKGGAIAILEGWGSVTIEDSLFDGNQADEDGGHIYVDLLGFSARLHRVDLVDGSADLGGALYATSASALDSGAVENTRIQLENTRIDGNVAETAGGALYLDGVTGTVSNCLLAANEAPSGAGLLVANGPWGLDVRNTIFTEHRGGAAVSLAWGAPPILAYDTFFDNDFDSFGFPDPIGVDGNADDDPEFVDRASGDHHLAPGSRLIDHGDPSIQDRDGTRSDIGLHGGPAAG